MRISPSRGGETTGLNAAPLGEGFFVVLPAEGGETTGLTMLLPSARNFLRLSPPRGGETTGLNAAPLGEGFFAAFSAKGGETTGLNTPLPSARGYFFEVFVKSMEKFAKMCYNKIKYVCRTPNRGMQSEGGHLRWRRKRALKYREFRFRGNARWG